uniref:Lipase domain-containing protein n=1 Tax=Drosophila arizonae TaxID=7263 RepID=A0A0B4UE96_DROAR|nr:hypothetical protein [Drosophila arizonae]
MLNLILILGCIGLELASANILLTPTNCFALKSDECPNWNITFWLHTHDNPEGARFTESDRFLPRRQLHVLIHGYAGSRTASPNRQLLPLLIRNKKVDVLSLEYTNLAVDPCYSEAVHNSRIVGRCLAYLLVSAGADLSNAHMIGFGIGAHVAGFAAKMLQKLNKRVNRISALDPAKPLYLTDDIQGRLDKSDAAFVDVIHSDVFFHGILMPLGHVDFYPNSGISQPGCGDISQMTTYQCYHKRSADYYAESITSPVGFYGFYCNNMISYIKYQCHPSANIERFGYSARPTARGTYYLQTRNVAPYANGKDFSNLDRNLTGKTFLGDAFVSMLLKQPNS